MGRDLGVGFYVDENHHKQENCYCGRDDYGGCSCCTLTGKRNKDIGPFHGTPDELREHILELLSYPSDNLKYYHQDEVPNYLMAGYYSLILSECPEDCNFIAISND